MNKNEYDELNEAWDSLSEEDQRIVLKACETMRFSDQEVLDQTLECIDYLSIQLHGRIEKWELLQKNLESVEDVPEGTALLVEDLLDAHKEMLFRFGNISMTMKNGRKSKEGSTDGV